jgi:hypothetical protein
MMTMTKITAMCELVLLLACAAWAPAAPIEVAVNDAAALSTAMAQTAPGGAVRLRAGIYSIANPLRPRSHTQIIGAGKDKTILKFASPQRSAIIELSGVEDVELGGMTLDGQNDPNAEHGITARDSRRLNIHDLKVMNLAKGTEFGPIGVYFSGDNPTREKGVSASRIANCAFENIGVGAEYGGGIRLSWGSCGNQIVGNTVRNTGRGGIFCNDGCTDAIIRNNTVAGSGGEGLGIEVWGGCDRAVIEDNQVDHWISLDHSNLCAVRRNVVSDKSGSYKTAGLELVGSSFAIFTDNQIDGGQHIGISVSGKDAKEFAFWGYNSIDACSTWAAQLQGEEGGMAQQYFFRCRFGGTLGKKAEPLYPDDAGHGLRTNGNVRRVTFEQCEFCNNEGIGIQLGGDGLEQLAFANCKIHGNRGEAVEGPAA